jgi:hypothetical protein
VSWKKSIFLAPLKDIECRHLFLEIAGEGLSEDPQLDTLIRRLDGLPLAAELLAYAAEGEGYLDGIVNRWNKKHDVLSLEELFTITDYEDRNASLFTSFEVSIQSRRMNDEAHHLLCCISLFPEGIVRTQLAELSPQQGDFAASILQKIGLIYYEADRLMMSAPLREWVAARHVPSRLSRHEIERITDMRAPIKLTSGSRSD